MSRNDAATSTVIKHALPSVLSKAKRKAGGILCLARLKIGLWATGSPFWRDYGFLKLAFHGDGDGQELLYHLYGRTWWRNELRALQPHIPAGCTVIDVGANVGFMTGLLSQMVGPLGHVHSFEPSPTTYEKLVALVDKNNLTNVTTHNIGCSDENNTLSLNLTESSGNSSMLFREELHAKIKAVQQVEVVLLDEYLGDKLQRLDLIKIDTEGFEDRVLAGAIGLLRRFRPTVYIELASEFRDSSERAIAILKEEGYRFDLEPDFRSAHTGDNFLAVPKKPAAV
jgi:FkbM family methyltransferase